MVNSLKKTTITTLQHISESKSYTNIQNLVVEKTTCRFDLSVQNTTGSW